MVSVPGLVSDTYALLVPEVPEESRLAPKVGNITVGPCGDCGWKVIWRIAPNSSLMIYREYSFLLSSLLPAVLLTRGPPVRCLCEETQIHCSGLLQNREEGKAENRKVCSWDGFSVLSGEGRAEGGGQREGRR